MKRSRLALVCCTPVCVAIAIVASCNSDEGAAPLKPGSGKIYQATKDSGGGEGGADASPTRGVDGSAPADADAAPPERPRQLQTKGQALEAVLVAYDAEIAEGEVGKSKGTTPPVKAFATDVVSDVKAARTRLRELATSSKVSPTKSNLSDRMKFESQGALGHVRFVPQNMFNDTFVNRRINAADSLLRIIDDELIPTVADDDAWRAEVDTIRVETDKRLSRANAVKGGLGVVGSSDGMFDEDDTNPAPQPTPGQPSGDAASPTPR